jgi:glutamyl-tRNA synthetase
MTCVRFAPSPTGYLHIGGVRTALFNYLYTRNQGGKFFLRIEDTDRERSKPEYEKEILSALKWLGLSWDNEPLMRQSERLAKYKEAADSLMAKGLAYEETTNGKKAVKFKMPAKKAVFHDMVHEAMEFDTSLFGDLVIMKSDGFPTYQLACVVDDHEMGVTHVIRGDDHLSNTPRQILLFEALGWKPPKYAHLPLILGDDGTPLSKRHGAVSLTAFREAGFIPEGILNYLALLGWGTEGNQELYSLEELIKKFSIKRVNKANARFNIEKLEWINAQQIKKLSEAEYIARITAFFEGYVKDGHKTGAAILRKFPNEKWKELVMLYRSRIRTFSDLLEQASYCFADIEKYEQETYDSFLLNKPLKKHMEAWWDTAKQMQQSDFEKHENVEKMTRDNAAGWGIEAKDLIHPLRFAVTGKTVSPGLFELMSVLGRDVCVDRLKKFLKK